MEGRIGTSNEEKGTAKREFGHNADPGGIETFEGFLERVLPPALSEEDIAKLQRFIENTLARPPPDFEAKRAWVQQIREVLMVHHLRVRDELGIVGITVTSAGRNGVIQASARGRRRGSRAFRGPIRLVQVNCNYVGAGLPVPER